MCDILEARYFFACMRLLKMYSYDMIINNYINNFSTNKNEVKKGKFVTRNWSFCKDRMSRFVLIEKIYHFAGQTISIDLDDGIKNMQFYKMF